LRFGGECELVWLNDKNALAVFGDPARAATALRRLDYGSAYQGASMFCPSSITQASASGNVWVGAQREGGSVAKTSANPWKTAGASDSDPSGGWTVLGHSPGANVLSQAPGSAWRRGDAAGQVMDTNRWNALESATTSSGPIAGAGQALEKLQPDFEVEDWEESCE
jgi:transcriptional repressor NF-X1